MEKQLSIVCLAQTGGYGSFFVVCFSVYSLSFSGSLSFFSFFFFSLPSHQFSYYSLLWVFLALVYRTLPDLAAIFIGSPGFPQLSLF
jgi:hypothetical protein